MKIAIQPNALNVVKQSLTAGEREYIETGDFPKVEIKEMNSSFRVTGKKQHLFDFLYDASVRYDVELM